MGAVCSPVILVLLRVRQEDYGFEANLGYIAVSKVKKKMKERLYIKTLTSHFLWAVNYDHRKSIKVGSRGKYQLHISKYLWKLLWMKTHFIFYGDLTDIDLNESFIWIFEWEVCEFLLLLISHSIVDSQQHWHANLITLFFYPQVSQGQKLSDSLL